MTVRERDIGRHFPSGSAKRKSNEDKLKKELVTISKIPKLTTFFQIRTSDKLDDLSGNSHPSTSAVETLIEDPSISTEDNLSRHSEDDSKEVNLEETESMVHGRTEEESTTVSTVYKYDHFENNIFSTDLGEWPAKLDERATEYWIAKGSKECQNFNCGFSSSKRYYEGENKTRFCQRSYFSKIHKLTNIKQERSWLCFSPSIGRLFCFSCKVMGQDLPNKFSTTGFHDWKNGNFLLTRHEESTIHKKTVAALLARTRRKKSGLVDFALVNQIDNEKQYWQKVLERIVKVIQFLAERGLPFRGSEEILGSPKNGNYLGLLELIAQFDPFLFEHINSHGSKGKGHTSYLSKDVCEEFISIIGSKISNEIISQLKKSKYYSVSLDSTPDSANIDQLTLIVRYVLPSGPIERFIKFLEMEGHRSAQLADSFFEFLKENEINIKDCRGQSYDNASNMSGKYNGLQALIKEKNPFAEYIPCFAHSLNLVGKCAAECCSEATLFFTFVENIYTFFSASTHRWGLLAKALSSGEYRLPLPKKLSDTRWSARADATSALYKGYSVIMNLLGDIAEDSDVKVECRQQARGLVQTMEKLETGIMVILWDKILERFQSTSASLQSSDQDLNSACALYESLHGYIKSLRSTFTDIEDKAKVLTDCHQYREEVSRKKKRNRQLYHFIGSTSDDSNSIESLKPCERFRIETFLVIIDSLVAALSKRQMAYMKLKGRFGFLRHLTKLTPEEISAGAVKLIKAYPEDVENKFEEELIHFAELLKTDLSDIVTENKQNIYELRLYRLLVDNSFGSCFPNVEIVLRIYLTLMVTNCSGERSFSKLKRIKNELRSSMSQSRLNFLSIMSIEHEILKEINISRIIEEFSVAKSRKRFI